MLVLPAEPTNAGLSGSFDNRHVNHLPTDFAMGLLTLPLRQSDQSFVSYCFHKTVSQDAQGYPRSADFLAVGHVLLDFCVGESGVWTDGAIIHQSAAGNDLGPVRDRNVWVIKKVVRPLMAYPQLRDLTSSS